MQRDGNTVLLKCGTVQMYENMLHSPKKHKWETVFCKDMAS